MSAYLDRTTQTPINTLMRNSKKREDAYLLYCNTVTKTIQQPNSQSKKTTVLQLLVIFAQGLSNLNKKTIMKKNIFYTCRNALLLSGMLTITSCQSEYLLTSIEGGRIEITAALDNNPDLQATAILAPYKHIIDSIMSPVIGKSTIAMEGKRPESRLSNFAADVLRQAATSYTGAQVEVAITNMGGLRSTLPEGDISYGNIYEIFPFENSLCILKMNGKDLYKLFEQIAKLGGECLSGAQITIGKDMSLLNAQIAGKPIDMNRIYTVATIDYLAEGNDGMTAFLNASEKICHNKLTIRKLVVDHIKQLTATGKAISAQLEGRITIK